MEILSRPMRGRVRMIYIKNLQIFQVTLSSQQTIVFSYIFALHVIEAIVLTFTLSFSHTLDGGEGQRKHEQVSEKGETIINFYRFQKNYYEIVFGKKKLKMS
jgi:hypothetical protein